METKKRILCFGDSLTWGWIPVEHGMPSTRYPFDERWTGAMAARLGDGYEIIEEGLSARTTALDDPLDQRLNGAACLPSLLASHFPLDLVIVMLGTNDTKSYFGQSAADIALDASKLLGMIAGSAGGFGTTYPAPRSLLIAPPPLGEIGVPWLKSLFRGAQEKSRGLAEEYEALASFFGAGFVDAGKHVSTDGVDGIHFTAGTNLELGRVIAEQVEDMAL